MNNTPEVIAATTITGDTWKTLLFFLLKYLLKIIALLVVDSGTNTGKSAVVVWKNLP